ncbi:MAG: sigma-54 dependent transcriptional regulator [Pseudomonadota bacterium]
MSVFFTPSTVRRVLMIDPCAECRALRPHLQRDGWRVECSPLDQALQRGGEVGLVRLDSLQHALSLRPLLGQSPTQWIAILSPGMLGQAGLGDFIAQWCFDFHTLPFDVPRLQVALGRAYGMARLRGQVQVDEDPHGLLGQSPSTGSLRRLIGKLAASDAPVLIRGESGTGKELIARSLHRQSRRSAGPFVALNCGAVAQSLIQSELFGHEKGAFTGAHQRKIGRIESADGGTLLLDEIGDLPLELQANLLRFLQEMHIERVGSSTSIAVDVRVLAATHIDLERAIEQGRFREDLYYRLNVLQVQTVPLRERRMDIPLLARHFSRIFSGDTVRRAHCFSESAMAAMLLHAWPGNVRELVNRVRRGLVLAENVQIEAADLGLEKTMDCEQTLAHLSEYLFQAERQALDDALALHARNRSQAARELGISRPTFYRLLHKHRIG